MTQKMAEKVKHEEELVRLNRKAFNKAHSVIINWTLRLSQPEFKTPLNDVVVVEVKMAIEDWQPPINRSLKRLHQFCEALLMAYKLAKDKGISDIDWLLEYREIFIRKCLRQFIISVNFLDQRPDFILEIFGNIPTRNVSINISEQTRKKYLELIKIYTSWLNQKYVAKDVEL